MKNVVPNVGDHRRRSTLRILLHGGDNMLGRAVQLTFPVQAPGEDQIQDSCTAAHYLDLSLGHPSYLGGAGMNKKDPSLSEIRKLNANKGSYLWGKEHPDGGGGGGIRITPPPDLRLLNVETAVTKSINNADIPWWKGINYHMHMDNFETIMNGFREETHQQNGDGGGGGGGGGEGAPVVAILANNHAMDYGRQALEEETLPLFRRLETDTFKMIGVGRNEEEASKPANLIILPHGSGSGSDVEESQESSCGGVAVQVFAFGAECAGCPSEWAARLNQSGMVVLPGLYSESAVDRAMAIVQRAFAQHSLPPQPAAAAADAGTPLRIVSLHWGPNWAALPAGGRGRGEGEQQLSARRSFAHRLIDEGHVDLIYGHSSHHCRGMEVYHNKLIVYGAGDIINDYEGFENPGEEQYNRLGAIYLVDVDSVTGNLEQLRMIPMHMNRLRLQRFHPETSWFWRPATRQLEQDPPKSVDFCRFLNQLSIREAGGAGHNEQQYALLLEHCDSDPQVPGGPILRSI